MSALSSEMLHASCVAIGDHAVLIEGLSGSGKSDLALRLIDRGAVLVSDDYTFVRRDGAKALAAPGPNIEGMIEVRGVGLVPMQHRTDVPVAMIVNLNSDVERLPEGHETRTIAGVTIPVVPVSPFEASASMKVELALKALS